MPELTAVVVGSAKSSGDTNTPRRRRASAWATCSSSQAANHLQSVAVLDLYVREPVVPGQLVKFADATGLELASKREDVARRIDELHVKISAWERDKSVALADLDARRQDLAKLEAAAGRTRQEAAACAGELLPLRGRRRFANPSGKDPAIDADMVSYYKAVERSQSRRLRRPRAAPRRSRTRRATSASTCARRATRRRAQVWNGTSHAQAYASLSSQFKEFNLECVSCHVTGYDKPGGSTVTHVFGLQDVQCEVCHGPGSRHAANPTDPTRIIGAPQPSTCLQCHHSPHVEGFDPVARMKDILGPGHGQPMK